MNRTHLFVATAAVLSLVSLAEPASRWWQRARQAPVAAVPVASAAGTLRLTGALSHATPQEGGTSYARFDVRATDARPTTTTAPVQMVLVIDRSGSMSGEKIARARAAANELVNQLSDQDELAVVTFGSDTTEFPLQRAHAEGKAAMHAFIDRIAESGGTNISGGLERAEVLLKGAPVRGIRRVVLMSDGQPTEGRTGTNDLVQLTSDLHEKGFAVTSLGIGYDFNGELMQKIAARGGGFYAYLNEPERLAEVLRLELGQARGAVARNVVLRLELSGGVELVQVAGREVVRSGNVVRVPLPDFAPGQTAQAFVELNVPSGVMALKTAARLEYFDAASDAAVVGDTAELAANTTPDAVAAEASQNKEVASDCIRAAGSSKMVAAAEAFERGDRSAANALLDRARGIFAMSADSLAGDMADVDATKDRWQRTTDPGAVAHESKSLSRKKMLNFGANNAY